MYNIRVNKNSRLTATIALLRTAFDLLTLAAVLAWALTSFALPLPGILVACAVGLATISVWALFLSARPVLHADRFARAAVSLVFYACGAAAALSAGVYWPLSAVLFALVLTINFFDSLAASPAAR